MACIFPSFLSTAYLWYLKAFFGGRLTTIKVYLTLIGHFGCGLPGALLHMPSLPLCNTTLFWLLVSCWYPIVRVSHLPPLDICIQILGIMADFPRKCWIQFPQTVFIRTTWGSVASSFVLSGTGQGLNRPFLGGFSGESSCRYLCHAVPLMWTDTSLFQWMA